MKKTMIGVLTVIMVLSIGGITAFAANRGTGRNAARQNTAAVQDTAAARNTAAAQDNTAIQNAAAAQNSTAVPNTAHHRNSGTYGSCGNICSHTDADNDGFCDNCHGYYSQNSQNSVVPDGCGRNYTDANGDGVCDNHIAGHNAGHNSGFHGGHHR